jgi:hypothetical protein
MRTGTGSRRTRKKPAPLPVSPPQIPHDLTWARTRAAAVGSQRLTAWAMARLQLWSFCSSGSLYKIICWSRHISEERICVSEKLQEGTSARYEHQNKRQILNRSLQESDVQNAHMPAGRSWFICVYVFAQINYIASYYGNTKMPAQVVSAVSVTVDIFRHIYEFLFINRQRHRSLWESSCTLFILLFFRLSTLLNHHKNI